MDWKWIQLAGGIVLGLFGWTIYWLGLQATGAVAGLAIGAGGGALVALLIQLPNEGMLAAVGIGAAAGLVLGVILSRALHKGMFFLLGAVAGSLAVHLGILLAGRAGLGQPIPMAEIGLRVVCCVAMGIVAVMFSKYIISLICSALATGLILAAFEFRYAELAAVPLFIMFFFVQTRFLKRLPEPEEHWEVSS